MKLQKRLFFILFIAFLISSASAEAFIFKRNKKQEPETKPEKALEEHKTILREHFRINKTFQGKKDRYRLNAEIHLEEDGKFVAFSHYFDEFNEEESIKNIIWQTGRRTFRPVDIKVIVDKSYESSRDPSEIYDKLHGAEHKLTKEFYFPKKVLDNQDDNSLKITWFSGKKAVIDLKPILFAEIGSKDSAESNGEILEEVQDEPKKKLTKHKPKRTKKRKDKPVVEESGRLQQKHPDFIDKKKSERKKAKVIKTDAVSTSGQGPTKEEIYEQQRRYQADFLKKQQEYYQQMLLLGGIDGNSQYSSPFLNSLGPGSLMGNQIPGAFPTTLPGSLPGGLPGQFPNQIPGQIPNFPGSLYPGQAVNQGQTQQQPTDADSFRDGLNQEKKQMLEDLGF